MFLESLLCSELGFSNMIELLSAMLNLMCSEWVGLSWQNRVTGCVLLKGTSLGLALLLSLVQPPQVEELSSATATAFHDASA